MKILHLSTSDIGGASEAALRLHNAFLAYGHESAVVVRKKHFSDNKVIQYKSFLVFENIWDVLTDILVRKFRDYYFLNTFERVSFGSSNAILSILPFTPDVIILHWISRFINMKTIYEIQKKTKAKIIWNMLDMAPMTGGCHYAWQCRGYLKRCGNCPALYSHSSNDQSSINFMYKKKYLRKINPIIITPSSELADQCKRSMLFKKNTVRKILLPVDLKKFYPGNKKDLREQYSISPLKKVVCFRSDNPNQKRKGFEYIVSCLSYLHSMNIRNVHVVIIGNINEADKKKIVFPYTIFSLIKDNIELADVYRLSDVFLCASIQDSGPMMINESIASGLPVVSFQVGVSKDLIIEGKTGYIARMMNSMDLARKINKLFSMNEYSYDMMTKSCRKLAIKKLSFRAVIKQYEQIL